MVKILFVCHGNICRSPMAEFLMRDLAEKAGRGAEFEIASAATSTEEIGNGVHPGTRRVLGRLGISCAGKTARQMTRADYDAWDYLVGMDSANVRNMRRICGGDPEGKIHKLMEYAGGSEKGCSAGDVADPWYTGDFETTYQDVRRGCEALLRRLEAENGREK